MDEYQKSQEDKNWEALRDAIPQWKSQPVPRGDSLQDDVSPPIWNKIGKMGVDPLTGPGGESGGGAGTERVICAKQSGSTFVPQIMIPPADTIFEDP